jgi:hypothetical protein
LHQHKKKLREERDTFLQDNNSMSKGEYWDDYSEDSEYSRERHGDPKHNRGAAAQSREKRYSRSITPQPEDEEEDFMQETLEVALIAAHAYLLTTRPEPGDPREDMQSRNTKPRDSRWQDQGKRSSDKVNKLQRKAKGEVQTQYHTKQV